MNSTYNNQSYESIERFKILGMEFLKVTEQSDTGNSLIKGLVHFYINGEPVDYFEIDESKRSIKIIY